jgi:hypothetical protein
MQCIKAMQVTLNVSEDLAQRLLSLQDQLPQILDLGIRELSTTAQAGFTGTADVLEFLANLPSPEHILALRPSEALQAKITAVLDKNRTQGLTSEEELFWEQYRYLEHLVRMAKTRALIKLRAT